MLERQFCDLLAVSEHHIVSHEDSGLCVRSFDIVERRLQILHAFEFTGEDFYTP